MPLYACQYSSIYVLPVSSLPHTPFRLLPAVLLLLKEGVILTQCPGNWNHLGAVIAPWTPASPGPSQGHLHPLPSIALLGAIWAPPQLQFLPWSSLNSSTTPPPWTASPVQGLPAFTMTRQLYHPPIQNISVTPEVPNHRTGVQTVAWPHQTTALMLTSHGSALRSPTALSLHLFRVVGKEHFFPSL